MRGLAAATVERFRAILQAMINYAAADAQVTAPKIRRTERIANKQIRFLTKTEETRLLAAYAPHVRPVAETLCGQGLRIGEAMQLDWRDINWAGNSLFIADTKTGEPRSVTLHRRVRLALRKLWVAADSPKEGRVFLNRLGRPYADLRQYKKPGGNPNRQAHKTAWQAGGHCQFLDPRLASPLGLPVFDGGNRSCVEDGHHRSDRRGQKHFAEAADGF